MNNYSSNKLNHYIYKLLRSPATKTVNKKLFLSLFKSIEHKKHGDPKLMHHLRRY